MATSGIATDPIETHPVPGTQLPPVVLDLGKTKKKSIKALKRGEGKLMDDVAQAVEAVRSNLGAELEGKALIPVVVVFERKAGRKGGFLPFAF